MNDNDAVLNSNQIECYGWAAANMLMKEALAIGAICIVERLNDDMFLVEVFPCANA